MQILCAPQTTCTSTNTSTQKQENKYLIKWAYFEMCERAGRNFIAADQQNVK